MFDALKNLMGRIEELAPHLRDTGENLFAEIKNDLSMHIVAAMNAAATQGATPAIAQASAAGDDVATEVAHAVSDAVHLLVAPVLDELRAVVARVEAGEAVIASQAAPAPAAASAVIVEPVSSATTEAPQPATTDAAVAGV
ncbi:hypothetical protein OYT13_11465 [Pandoraea sp. XJJ-1]|uniref:hypothetical protein n=1 Tax=Pandoraea sp. XJJ-1 TaxID=3002643 RepID=UPI002281311B|nr:hypothetical protein [Pandoraea sp. XJJ-1]WAL84965.1 hypothetical protein OYT13_11465 [Pandoraea sp. XJJ-1]